MERTYVVQYETEMNGESCEELEVVITSEVELSLRKLIGMIKVMHPSFSIVVNDHQEQEYERG